MGYEYFSKMLNVLMVSCSCLTTILFTVSSVFTRNGDVVTVTTPSDCRWLQVEFRPQIKGAEDGEEEQRRKVKVPATGNMVSNLFSLLSRSLFNLCIIV